MLYISIPGLEMVLTNGSPALYQCSVTPFKTMFNIGIN